MGPGQRSMPDGAGTPADSNDGTDIPRQGSVRRAREGLAQSGGNRQPPRLNTQRLAPTVPRMGGASPGSPSNPQGLTYPPISPSGATPDSVHAHQYPAPVPVPWTQPRGPTIGATFRPSNNVQWPLPGGSPQMGNPSPNQSPRQEEFNAARRPPPRRSPRPIHSGSFEGAAPIPEYGPAPPRQPSFPVPPELPYWEQNFERSAPGPVPISAGTGNTTSFYSSRPSTTSSAMTIPEFPVPVATNQANLRRSVNLAPPNGRRTHSSYYSRTSVVSPIQEEGDSNHLRVSHVSSQVPPSSWGSGPPDYYLSPEADGFDPMEREYEEEEPNDGRDSRSTIDDEERGLVREASLGKRHKPSLTTITSSERESSGRPGIFKQKRSSESLGKREQPRTVIGEALTVSTPSQPGSSRPDSVQDRNRTFYAMSTSTEATAPTSPPTFPEASRRPSETSGSNGSELKPEGADRLQPPAASSSGGSSAGSPRRNSRKPPRLNMEAVKEAENRGSLTSMSDLIMRATKLAQVLERGRPASRLDALSMDRRSRIDKLSPADRRSGSISDMLASFPSPSINSPRDPPGSRAGNREKSPFATSALAYGENADSDTMSQLKKPRRKRCCGMSMPVFILVLALVLLVIAAAIILPVVFVVIPKHQQHKAASTSQSQCAANLTCMNGGRTVLEGTTCRCLCVGGYTGSSCTLAPANGCVTTDINSGSSKVSDATLGSSIPRLLQEGPEKFNVPLDSSAILSRFSASNLSCGSENALVTFDGRSNRASSGAPSSASQTATAQRQRRHTHSISKRGGPTSTMHFTPAATSNGIVFASPSQTTPSSSPNPTATGGAVTEESLDFARVSVLYIMQLKSLDTAVEAQQDLQSFFTTLQDWPTASAGNDITVDFSRLTLKIGNVTVGGKSKPTSTSTRG